MSKYILAKCATVLAICLFLLSSSSCSTISSYDDGKIPITTSSEKAREYYLQGQELADKFRAQESIRYFEKAVAEDPDFALAYLMLSFVAPSTKEFFDHFNKAQTLANKVSEGERLLILSFDAAVNDEPMKQRELLTKLVTAYPNDERAHDILADHYSGQQEYELAIEERKKAIEINPNFSPPYNMMGYNYRSLGNYSEAEEAFKKYIELIPDDPNPYDSYAELLLKMGKYDASIDSYQKALEINPNFVFSHVGIATNLCFKGEHQQARDQLQKFYDMAHDDGERRTALFARAVIYVDEGKTEMALEELNKQYTLADKINDAVAMSGDLGTMANILLEAGKFDEAMAKFEKSLLLIEKSDLSQKIKENVKRGHLFNTARVALMKGDFTTAKAKSEEYHRQAEVLKNSSQIRSAHQLAGMIALEEKDYDKALEELHQANQQNSYNLYRISLAYQGKGDSGKAKEFCMRTINFNALNSLNHCFAKKKAERMLAAMTY